MSHASMAAYDDDEIEETKTAEEILNMVLDLEKENDTRMKKSMKFLEGFKIFEAEKDCC